MASTTTTKLALVKPTPGTAAAADVSVINANMDKVDVVAGMTVATATGPVTSPFSGQTEFHTDTKRAYFYDPVSAVKRAFVTQGAPFIEGVTGAVASVRLQTTTTPALNRALATRQTTDTQDRHSVDYDGNLMWGPGNAGLDTNLYRSAADTLKTDDSFEVGANLTIAGIGRRQPTRQAASLVITGTGKQNTDLSFAVAAGATYQFDMGLFHIMSSTGDFVFNFTFPAGRISYGFYAPGTAIPASGSSVFSAEFRARSGITSSPSTDLAAGSMTDGALFSMGKGIFVSTGAAGTVRLQAAQSSNAGTSTVLIDSFMMAERVA